MKNSTRRALTGLLFCSPWIIGFLVFIAFPFLRTIKFSINHVIYTVQEGYQFTYLGIGNFKSAILGKDGVEFIVALQDYIVRTIIYVPVIVAVSIIVAMLLNSKLKGTTFFRLVFFLPIIILNGELMRNMTTYGGMSLEVNGLIIEIVNKLAPESMVGLIILLFNTMLEILWYCGVPILIFLAALQKIDKSVYEAAQIDGASPWNIFWKITLPTIYSLVSVSIVFVVVFLANFDANPINGIIKTASNDLRLGEGFASALALIYAFVQTVIVILLFIVTRRKDGRE
jgi:ABC-type sugar transport system permease subunit